jgi:hypothetical protein
MIKEQPQQLTTTLLDLKIQNLSTIVTLTNNSEKYTNDVRADLDLKVNCLPLYFFTRGHNQKMLLGKKRKMAQPNP